MLEENSAISTLKNNNSSLLNYKLNQRLKKIFKPYEQRIVNYISKMENFLHSDQFSDLDHAVDIIAFVIYHIFTIEEAV